MRILNKITELAMLMSIAVSAASCNKITLFDEAFVAFDTAKSSVVSINATGEFTGSYTLHYTGPKPSAPIVVNFVVACGNGLAEGVDYKVATAGGKITFMPGIYEQVIKIDWIPHEIDESKDNTVTISLVSADGVTLGYPGPDKLMKDLVIRKYTTK
ncbi:putative uncharacterized protein [Bacteroides sp. CAG:709]|nr:putative uncharacterized protein [Bacteroides sp. CAG:709]